MGLNLRKKSTVFVVSVFGIFALLCFWKLFIDAFGEDSRVQSSVLAPQNKPSADASPISAESLPVIANLTADSAGIKNLPITLGTSDKVLDSGMAGAYPWSGPGELGVFSVSAHRVGAGGPFLNLDKMKSNDLITVTNNSGKEFKYRVTSVEIVEPNDVSVLKGPKDESRLVLITCTPIETYADRLVITAVLDN